MKHHYLHKLYSFLNIRNRKAHIYWYIPLLALFSIMATTEGVHAQASRITGQVVAAEDGEPIPGATVLVKGTTNGTISDIDGNYSLSVDDPSGVLVFSYVGYLSEEVPINNQSVINMSLVTDITQLEEVVVVGYGTIKKTDLTGSVGVVSGENIAERGTVNPIQAIQGQIAGVDISAGSGRAGAEYNIQIRGQNTLADASPLYVVDGVFTDNINFINPQDIERIDVLKDASSTAIYGSRGSNGVVIVTTKQGTGVRGEATISYDGYYGVRQNVRHPDFMNGDEWFEFRQNAYIIQDYESGEYDETAGGLGNAPYITARRVALKEYTDWPSYFLQTGTQQNHWLSISGTTENNKMNYIIGGGYQEEKGNLLKDYFNRYNFKASVSHQLNEQWSAGASVNLSLTETERGSETAITNAYRMSPLTSPYDSLGNILFQPAKYGDVNYTSSVNPLVDIANSEDNTKRLQGIGNLYIEFSPLEWLDIRSTISPQFRNRRRGRFFGSETEARKLQAPAANLEKVQEFSYIWDNTININKTINDHSFNFTGLYSQFYAQEERSYISVENLPFESGFHNLGSADDILEVASRYVQETMLSYMARLNYSFKDKYLITLSNRWDGSSVLGEGNKWNSFPSAALGWRISEEPFLQDVAFIYNLKARVSYGYTGNNNIDPYSTSVLVYNETDFDENDISDDRNSSYDFGGELAGGLLPSGIVNAGLTWERTREFNVGLDYELFQGRIAGSIDVYDKESDGLLLTRQLPFETGNTSMVDNVGSVQNKGIELALRTINVQTSDFTWSTSFNFSKNSNEILELYGGQVTQAIGENDEGPYAWIVGEDISSNYTYAWDGVWQADEEPHVGYSTGQIKLRDVSGPEGIPDGEITPDDRIVIGASSPDWSGGFSTQFSYKGFDLSASLYTRQGVQVHSPFHEEFTNLGDRGRAKLDVDYYMLPNTVTPTRITNSYPIPREMGNYYDDVAFYQDASYVKVQNILLGYNFPASTFLERARIKHLRLYVNVLNPFVFTDYEGFDPEWAGEDLEDTGNASVTYQFGVNLKF